MQNIYNNPLVKKLAVARAGIRWIRNISKFTGTMPDGLAVNESRLTEYKEEEEKWLERIWEESETPDFLVA